MKRLILLTGLFSLLLLSCSNQSPMASFSPVNQQNALSYLALGDSYTIGEAVPAPESFPYQLRDQLLKTGVVVAAPQIIATTGWTTGELAAAIKAQKPRSDYDIVTLLIGVNNQYRGYNTDDYRTEFVSLLNQAIGFAKGDKSRVYVVSIPDWGVTPFGKNSGRNVSTISAEIDLYNKINKEETLRLGVSYTDITPDSRKANTDLSLIASDGLHPSGLMYAGWAQAVAPKVAAYFK